MLHALAQTVEFIPLAFLIPLGIGSIVAVVGLVLLPPTYHWDGKMPARTLK